MKTVQVDRMYALGILTPYVVGTELRFKSVLGEASWLGHDPVVGKSKSREGGIEVSLTQHYSSKCPISDSQR
jgi:hypothetical protein